jgi:hypothetical protein
VLFSDIFKRIAEQIGYEGIGVYDQAKDTKDIAADNPVAEPKTPSVSDQLAEDLERGLNKVQTHPTNWKYPTS